MTKFRKKVLIEAERWFPRKEIEGVYFASDGSGYYVSTLEGRLRVQEGDWIITGVQGEKYPCKNDIFEATYEAV